MQFLKNRKGGREGPADIRVGHNKSGQISEARDAVWKVGTREAATHVGWHVEHEASHIAATATNACPTAVARDVRTKP